MSARYLKKVLKQQEHNQFHEINDGDGDGDGDDDDKEEQLNENEIQSNSFINPFDLLNDEISPQEDDEFETVDETIHEHKQDNSHQEDELGSVDETLRATIDEENQPSKTNNKKSKKKKRKKTKEVSSSITGKAKESLDVQLDSLSLKEKSSGPLNGKSETDLPLLLQVDPKYLNVENELIRIFGSKVVKSFEKKNPAGSSRHARGGRRPTRHSKKTSLTSPSHHWPAWNGSFSMEFLETKNGIHYFRYVDTPSYSQAQRAFQAAKSVHDLNSIASILVHHPYHLDSILTMAEYFKFVGEHQASADAIAMCLYALECAWHPTFTPFQNNCQLKFSEETNKPMFTALFAHMRYLDRRGCHRSALEVCKLLLSLDSDDPMGALFCVDYYALRAEEYAWLENFCEHYNTDSYLSLFPNFSYSLAICRLYLEREVPENEKSSSNDIMKQALMLHPSVIKKLVAKVPLKDQAWTRILENSFFGSEQKMIPSLDHLINIYVERCYLIWRLPDVQKLLRDSALSVLEDLEHSRDDAKDWACVRDEAFSSEKNEYGHLLVQDFSDSMPNLPPDNLQNFMVDPRMHIGDQNVNPFEEGDVPAPLDIENRNPLATLIELIPWMQYVDDDVEEAHEDIHTNNDHDHGQSNDE
ncbi:hypothetical protein ACFE04_019065 [Oxalis oulophora]